MPSTQVHFTQFQQQMKLEELREQRQGQDNSELTFKPNINHHPRRHMNASTDANYKNDNIIIKSSSSSFGKLPVRLLNISLVIFVGVLYLHISLYYIVIIQKGTSQLH